MVDFIRPNQEVTNSRNLVSPGYSILRIYLMKIIQLESLSYTQGANTDYRQVSSGEETRFPSSLWKNGIAVLRNRWRGSMDEETHYLDYQSWPWCYVFNKSAGNSRLLEVLQRRVVKHLEKITATTSSLLEHQTCYVVMLCYVLHANRKQRRPPDNLNSTAGRTCKALIITPDRELQPSSNF